MNFFIDTAFSYGFWLINTVLPFLIVLTIIVFFHELGHFLVARWNKVDVEVFSVGFGWELIGFNDRHGTRWKISAIPLGGYVKFSGDMNSASFPDKEKIDNMNEKEKKGSFAHKLLWQKALIVAAGPLANFILAILIFSSLNFLFGKIVTSPTVSEIVKDSPAYNAGFKAGDQIISVDGTDIESFNDIKLYVHPRPNQTMNFVVKRDQSLINIQLTTKAEEISDKFNNKQKVGIIGIKANLTTENTKIKQFNLFQALGSGIYESWYIVKITFKFLYDAIAGRQDIDQLGGPLQIAKLSKDTATVGLTSLAAFIAVLSVSIGLINLFPIPILDGGHLLFYIIEAVTGRPVSIKIQTIAHHAGMAVLLLLMVFVSVNDINKIFFQ